MRELVERTLEEGHVLRGAAREGGRRVSVNLCESTLTWLAARGHVDSAQLEAGERLRGDYETAAIAPSVTMRWAAAPAGRGRRGAPEAADPTLIQLAAKRRFDAALAMLGPGLADVAWRVVCAGEGLAAAERSLGWPARAGKLVLTLALDRLVAHYRIRR